ncbi:DUF4238 domain-containing protein [Devosia nitrariae]|uniref:DUF4238 domain-containing protein n=1 Tax=Devosia nitrariae TaxID=2071872 RepID=A0ABQ5W225_9HYPH|nr:DUF4238 domain-containing protein [Devosia nitrariae]GLQ53929.1 hypothetical protein GCM10010862_11880 [Devosia nitrariae]
MNDPKLHHYVPQFHLRRFTDATGRLWVWDRDRDRTFRTSPGRVAAEKQFYRLTQYEAYGHDPMTMEKQLSTLEGEVALITEQWLSWLRMMEPLDKVEISAADRQLVALYIAVQFLRTADTRDTLSAYAAIGDGEELTADEQRRLHTEVMWDEGLTNGLASRFGGACWVFARNETATPFVTSDNPIAFRTADNRRWLKAGILAPGVYIVFPLAPDIILYAYPGDPPFQKLSKFADCLSPVALDNSMVTNENSGQVFMASRFVLSNRSNFDAERAFALSIGTDLYADPVGHGK